MPKKKKSKSRKLTVPLIILVLIIVFGSALFLTRQTVFGGTVLSLTQVDLKSSYTRLSGKVWVYTFVQGGLGQFAEYTVNPDEASDEYSGKESPENKFKLSVSYDKQQCEFPTKISSFSTSYHDGQIYEVKKIEYNRRIIPPSCDSSSSKQQEMCGSGWTPMLFYSESGFSKQCNIICGLRRTGQTGRLENPQINSIFTVTVSSDAKGEDGKTSYSETFQTMKNTKGEVGEHVYITWDGNLNTGKQCKDKDPYMPIYRNGKWQLVSSQKYDDYSDALDDLIANTKSDDDANFKIPEVNRQMKNALNIISLGNFENSASQTNAQWILDVVNQDLARPVITAFVEAKWVGITTPIGKPKIVSIDAPTFRSGSDGTVKVKVKNIGDELGTFNVYGTCSNSKIDIYTNKEISVRTGKTETVYLGITAQVSKKTEFDCTIIAKGTQFKDEKSFKVTIDIAGKECEPNEKVCSSDGNIYKCNEEGTKRVLIESCANGCTNDEYGQPYCKEDPPPPPPPPPTCKPLIDIKNPIDESKSWIKVDNPFCNLRSRLKTIAILSSLIFFLGTLFAFKKKFYDSKKKKDRSNFDLVLIILGSALIGGLIYILVQSFFDFIFSFWGIVTIIILLVVLTYFNKIKILLGL